MYLKLNIKKIEGNEETFNPQTIEIYISEQANEEGVHSVQIDRTEVKDKQTIRITDDMEFDKTKLGSLLKSGTFPAELDENKVNEVLKEYGYEIDNSVKIEEKEQV